MHHRPISLPSSKGDIYGIFDLPYAPSNSASASVGIIPPEPDAADFSGTNNQEENVDEADLLKTDGQFIYTITRRTLSIIRAYPYDQAEVLSTLSFS